MRRLIVLVILVGAVSIPAANVVAGGGGCHGDHTDAPAHTIRLDANCFTPTVARIGIGEAVTWTNADGWTHNVYSSGFAGSGDLDRGDDFTVRFDQAGVYPYVCTFHPGMMGAVVVSETGAEADAGDALSAPSERAEQAAGLQSQAVVEPAAADEPNPTVALGLLLTAVGAIFFTGVAMARRGEAH